MNPNGESHLHRFYTILATTVATAPPYHRGTKQVSPPLHGIVFLEPGTATEVVAKLEEMVLG
jgi:hypothetical protein